MPSFLARKSGAVEPIVTGNSSSFMKCDAAPSATASTRDDDADHGPLLTRGHTATPHSARSAPISARGSLRRENRVAGDERVGARLPDLVNRVAVDSAVHLERRVAPLFVEHQSRAANLVDRVRNELAARRTPGSPT